MKRRVIAFALALLSAGAGFSDQPLEPEQAFRLSVHALDATTLEARWRIADGYYLYRDKMRFAVDPAKAKLGVPRFSPAEVKDDEFFGKVEIYRNEATVILPLSTLSRDGSITLKADYQGCAADLGICYPLSSRETTVRLAAGKPAPRAPLEAKP